MKNLLMKAVLAQIILLAGLSPLRAQQDATQAPADNTKVNQRDQDRGEPTADQQKNNKSDLELTREIRQALVKDKSLSINAHNIKVIAQNGVVTLKGPVKSEEEKQAVEAKAAQIAGPNNVTNEVEVAPK
jgi:osmotically-inducible protein OsmY